MTAARGVSRRRLTLAHMVLTMPWVALIVDAWAPIRDNSFLWHIRAGTVQLGIGEVLTEDPFSFTTGGRSWRTQSWLAELFYGWAEGLWNLGFVPSMMLVLTTLSFVGVGLVTWRWSQDTVATAVVMVLSTILMLRLLVPRPVIFSFALFPLVQLAWSDRRCRFTLPFLFWVWASVHGSFVVGLAWVFLVMLMDREWRAVSVLAVSGAAALATAHGIGILDILLDFSASQDALTFLTEWRRPELISPIFTPFLVGIGLLVIGAWRQKIAPRHLILVAPFLLLGFSATRAVPPAWLGLVPLVGLSLQKVGSELPRRFSKPAAVVFASFVVAVAIAVKGDGGLDDEHFPVAAAGHLQELPTFHDDRTGGYLIYASWPRIEVFIDDRAELYRERIAEFAEIRAGERDWQSVFDRDGIRQVLLRTDESLVLLLEKAGWEPVFRDEDYVVLR